MIDRPTDSENVGELVWGSDLTVVQVKRALQMKGNDRK